MNLYPGPNIAQSAVTELSHLTLEGRQVVYISVLQLRKGGSDLLKSLTQHSRTCDPNVRRLTSKPELHPPHLFLGAPVLPGLRIAFLPLPCGNPLSALVSASCFLLLRTYSL